MNLLKRNFPQANLSLFLFNKNIYFPISRVIAFGFLLFAGVTPLSLNAENLLYKTSYICYESDDTERWRATTEIIPFKGEGAYRLIERGEGHYSGNIQPFESAHDEVLGFVPRIRIDVFLKNEDVDQVIARVKACSVCVSKLGLYWTSTVDSLGEI